MKDKRLERLEQGKTCLANKRIKKGICADEDLINWAKETGRYEYIGKGSGYAKESGSVWYNPYNPKELKITQEKAVAEYREYLFRSPGLMDRIEELRGKLLVCWCYPDDCHGDVLIELLEES